MIFYNEYFPIDDSSRLQVCWEKLGHVWVRVAGNWISEHRGGFTAWGQCKTLSKSRGRAMKKPRIIALTNEIMMLA